MNCYYHPDRESHHVCTECGRELCEVCMHVYSDKIICKHCEEEIRSDINYGFGKHMARFLSLIPGAGHMYLGLMEKGLLLLLATIGCIAMIDITGSELFGFGIVIIWFYSMFDAYHLRRRVRNGETILQNKININKMYIAYGFITVGGVILVNVIMDDYVRRLLTYMEVQRIRSILMPLLLIAVGVVMVLKLRNASDNGEDEAIAEISDSSSN